MEFFRDSLSEVVVGQSFEPISSSGLIYSRNIGISMLLYTPTIWYALFQRVSEWGGGVKYKKLWRKDEIERLVGLETKLTIKGDACNSARWGINQIDTQWKAFWLLAKFFSPATNSEVYSLKSCNYNCWVGGVKTSSTQKWNLWWHQKRRKIW